MPNGNDGLQILAALSGRYSGCALVGFPVNGHVTVAPILRTEPLYSSVDALPFTVSTVVEAARAFFGGKHGDLRQCIAVRNEIIVDELAATGSDHVGWAGLAAG